MTLQKSEFTELTESAHEQCQPGVRRNDFGMWGFYLGLIFGVVASHCIWGLPEFWQNFWGRGDMDFTKFNKSGPNLQRLKLEKFEKRNSGSSWIQVVGAKDYPEELV